MRTKKKIAALIINWNGAEDTLELLHSLCKCQTDWISITAVVIDNASRGADLLKLEENIKKFDGIINLVFRANSINIGVPAAYNQAIQIAGLNYDHYLRLDNDVVVDPQGLAAMVDVLDQKSDEGIAIVGGDIRYYDRQNENNGGAVTVDLIAGRTTAAYPVAEVVCDGVLGCIMLLSGKLVRRYAPEVFESALFICTDETELSLRAAGDGMRTIYLARRIGLHKGGQSTGKVHFMSDYYSARNWTLHRLRYVAGNRQRFAVLVRFPLDIGRSLLRGRWAFPLGWVAGLGLAIAWFLDRRIRRGRC